MTPKQQRIEDMAKAICEQHFLDNGNTEYDDCHEIVKAGYRDDAQAAYTASGVEELLSLLSDINAQLECPVRNTCKGRAFRDGVVISEDIRQRVKRALEGK